VTLDVASWTMSTADDVTDSAIQVKLGDTVLGTAPLDNTIGTVVYDAYGTAHVDVPLPSGTPGDAELTLVGADTGTEIAVPITLEAGVPGKPTGPTTTPTGPRKVEVSFTPPADNGSTITRYRAKCVSDHGGITGYGTNTASPVTVAGLKPGRRYRCAVQAENAVGWGAYSVFSPWVAVPGHQ